MEPYQSFIVKTIEIRQLNLHPAMWALWKSLQDHDIGLFVVGGAVRDQLRGTLPLEYDFVVDLPMETFFDRAKVLGFKCTVLSEALEVGALEIKNTFYEVARLRREAEYKDNRHPEQVTFTSSVNEDSDRRDFTVNGLYLSLSGDIYDFHQGYEHLREGVLKVIGDPQQKMSQDALRLLRAIRVAAKTELLIDKDLLAVMQSLAYTLCYISMERRMDELRRILNHWSWHRGLTLLENCGFLKSGYHFSAGLTALRANTLAQQFTVVFAQLVALESWDFNEIMTERLIRYALSREEKEQIYSYLWAYKQANAPLDILFNQGENLSGICHFFSGFKNASFQETLDYFQQCQVQGLPMSILELALSKKQLMELGADGKQMKALLYTLFIGVHKGFYENAAYVLEREAKILIKSSER